MPKKLAPQSDELLRGTDADTNRIADNCLNNNILAAAFNALENETIGIVHGQATLTVHVKDGILLRYEVSRKCSFVPGKPSTGGGQ